MGRLSGRLEDVTADAGYDEHPPRMGFFTDTSVCIGCKACEVACKEWNEVPDDAGFTTATGETTKNAWTGTSYDTTHDLGANTWRHVAFVEQKVPVGQVSDSAPDLVAEAARQSAEAGGVPAAPDDAGMRWLMASDVCKHCTEAGCLDVCPTGAIFRTEFGTVVVQEDVCNGCGYCIVACPFGVIDRRQDDGRAWKCTLCYDRLRDDMEPACAQACPTDSIQFGELDDLRERAAGRVEALRERGHDQARLYGADEDDGVGGFGAFFLLLDEPETYGLPPDPVDPTRHGRDNWTAAGLAAAGLLAGVVGALAAGRR